MDKDVQELDSDALLVGYRNSITTLENSYTSLQKLEYTYHMIKPFYSSVFTQEKWKHISVQRFVHERS